MFLDINNRWIQHDRSIVDLITVDTNKYMISGGLKIYFTIQNNLKWILSIVIQIYIWYFSKILNINCSFMNIYFLFTQFHCFGGKFWQFFMFFWHIFEEKYMFYWIKNSENLRVNFIWFENVRSDEKYEIDNMIPVQKKSK